MMESIDKYDEYQEDFVAVQLDLDNYESIVPNDPTVCAKWEFPRQVHLLRMTSMETSPMLH